MILVVHLCGVPPYIDCQSSDGLRWVVTASCLHRAQEVVNTFPNCAW